MTLDDIHLEVIDEGDFLDITLHPLRLPYSPNRPKARIYFPDEVRRDATDEEIGRFVHERIALDLDEIYCRGMFAGQEPDEWSLEMRELLEK